VIAGWPDDMGDASREGSCFASRFALVAQELATGQRVQALVVDPESYEDDPLELLRHVSETRPGLPVLLALHAGQSALASRCAERGVTDLIAKPIDWDFLELRLPILLRSHQEKLEAEAGMRLALSHDPLTGLPNRSGAQEILANALITTRRIKACVGVLCLDLIGFDRVNELVGIEGGDRYLREVVNRVRACLRRSDVVAQLEDGSHGFVASRLGGDTFGIFVPGLRDSSDAVRIVRRIIDAASSVIETSGSYVSCSANVGIAQYPEDSEDPATLLQRAESVVHRMKEQGRTGYEFYSKELASQARRRLQVETGLRSAVERGEVKLHYQPKIELQTGRLTGMEGLIRWQSDSLGRVNAPELIEAAERTGLISEIGRWVIWEACAQNREWQHRNLRRVPVAVNVSASQLRDPEFVDTVISALVGTGLDPHYLQLEVTEGILIENSSASAEKLSVLRSQGVSVALDDFGAGYASLAYLTGYPLDVVKFDRQFIVGMTFDPGIARIVQSVTALAHGMGLRVVAEGVDEPGQVEFLEECGCDEIQGFLVSEALPQQEFASCLERLADGPEVWLREAKGRSRQS
jgi:diguanylate cyclase (GGDEF)-like protein